MKKQFTGLVLAAMAGSASAYQFEASGMYIDFDDLDDSALGVMGEYHFNPVSTKNLPLAEADFLGRSSNVGIFYTTVDEADVDALGFGGEAYMQDFYFAAGVTRTDFGNVDTDDFEVRVGFLPANGLRFTVGFEDDDLGTDSIGVDMKWVNKLQGEMSSNVEAALSQLDDADDTMVYSIAGDLYFNNMLSVGLGYQDTDDSNSNEEVELRARMFFIPTLSAQISYYSQDFNDRIMLGVTGRF